MLKIIFEIFIMAISFTILFSWGYIKKQRQGEELFNRLLKNCEIKIYKLFKKEKTISKNDLIKEIEGTKGSLFWSKNKMVVKDPNIFIEPIIDNMIKKGEIIEKKNKIYCWVEGANL